MRRWRVSLCQAKDPTDQITEGVISMKTFIASLIALTACDPGTQVSTRSALTSASETASADQEVTDDGLTPSSGAKAKMRSGSTSDTSTASGTSLTIPECGQAFEAVHEAKGISKNIWGTAEHPRHVEVAYTTTLKTKGAYESAVYTVVTQPTLIKNISNATNERVLSDAVRNDGTYNYEFYVEAGLRDLKSRAPEWQKIECGLLPTRKITILDNKGQWRGTVKFENRALPSLVTPNASGNVFEQAIGSSLSFAEIAATIERPNYRTTPPPQSPTETLEAVIRTNIERSVVSQKRISIVATAELLRLGQSVYANPNSLTNQEFLLAYGIYPKIEYIIDLGTRFSTDIKVLTIPYNHGRDGWSETVHFVRK